MATNESGSLNGSLNEGATDGKYRKVRPNTTVAKGSGDDLTLANRRALHAYWNYDYIDQEAPNMQSPGVGSTKTNGRMSVTDAAIVNDQMGASN